MEPNCKYLGDDIVEMYGIKFGWKEGSTDGWNPIPEISERNNVSIEDIETCLKKYDLLDEKSEPSQNMHVVKGFTFPKDYKEGGRTPLFVFVLWPKVLRPKKGIMNKVTAGQKTKDSDFIDLGMCVNEKFIIELMEKE